MSKKLFLLVGVIASAALIAACAPAPTAVPPAAPTTAPAATVAPTAAPKAATAAPTAAPAAVAGACGTLRILYWQAVTVLNSHHSQGTKDYDGARLVLEPLAATNPRGEVVPALAVEVPTIANGGVAKDLTSVTWKLKPGVKWSDGTDFTADDVVFTWKYGSDPATATTDAGTLDNVKTVEAVDKNTVKVTWKAPNANPYEAFVTGLGNILQKKQFEPFMGAKSKDGLAQIPVGTGPFKFKEFKPNDVVTYDMNPNYRDFAKGKPCFSAVTFKGGGDAASAAKAVFQTGEVDYAWNLQVEASVLVPMANAADSKGVLGAAVSPNLERLLVNRTNPDPTLGDKRAEPDQPHPFLSDLNVRKALAMVINTTEMARQLYGPAGDGTCLVLNTPLNIVSKNITCPKGDDAAVAAANKLLDDAGWKKGTDGIREKVVGGKTVKMSIIYQTTVNALRQKEQEFVKDAWTKLGVKTELKSVAAGVFFSTDEANPDTAGKFFTDIEMFTNGQESLDPTNYLRGWTCGEIKTKAAKWSGNNYERFCSKEYDDLYAQMTKETDPAKRSEFAIKMNDILVNDVVVIPLVARKSVTGWSKALKGIDLNGAWDSEMWNIADWTNK
ncbi:MAG: peptide ABC transporter substrate-binding protein [Chloroflexi bacterium]|nr:peptide ABC transporter substrate-binding protein [Chloroflexota bacterium]